MKKFTKLLEAKDLGYKSFFGKEVPHSKAFEEMLKSSLICIIMEERKVSEKNFSEIDKITEDVSTRFTNDIIKKCSTLYKQDKRISFIAEIIYDRYFK